MADKPTAPMINPMKISNPKMIPDMALPKDYKPIPSPMNDANTELSN